MQDASDEVITADNSFRAQHFCYFFNTIPLVVEFLNKGSDFTAMLFVNIFPAQMGWTMDIAMKNDRVYAVFPTQSPP